MNGKQSLVELIDKELEAGTVELPVFDQVAMNVYRSVRADEINADELCDLLQEDPVLVGEVLRVANSSFYSGLSGVTTLKDAVVRLGTKQVASLALAASQKRIYSASASRFQDRLVTLWKHAAATAFGARWLAQKTGHRDQADEAFVAGLLHDVGKTSLLRIIEDLSVRDDALNVADEVIDLTLDQLCAAHGAKLLETWNVPEVFRQIVIQQHADTFDENDVLVAIVRLVDRACAREGISDRPDPSAELEASREARALGLNAIQIAELQVVLEDASNSA